jgi:hypothetical protein
MKSALTCRALLSRPPELILRAPLQQAHHVQPLHLSLHRVPAYRSRPKCLVQGLENSERPMADERTICTALYDKVVTVTGKGS